MRDVIFACLFIFALIIIVVAIKGFFNDKKAAECETRGGELYLSGQSSLCLTLDGKVLRL